MFELPLNYTSPEALRPTTGCHTGGGPETEFMSRKPRVTPRPPPAQERRRTEGLRMLARVIARHYLAHPELYPVPTVDGDGGNGGAGGTPVPKEVAE